MGQELTKEEMKNIIGGTDYGTGYCIACTDGEITNAPCPYDMHDCISQAVWACVNNYIDAVVCSDGTACGDMSSCPL